MDVFSLRDRVIQDYASYVRSFVQVRDRRIDEFVKKSLKDEVLWPQPLIQLNPSFEPGGWVDNLVDWGLLHAGCRKIFRIKTEEDPIGSRMLLHRHQVEAIEAGRRGQNYALTTGTGSGKSLTYLIPIVDRVLRNGGKRGIQAVVVYPMNALCNSQYGELEKFLRVGFGLGKEPVRFDRYTGQESREQRDQIIQNPPDILLTNYVMLELLLTRPFERPLVNAARDLRFLVLDELHTYRGRQGADVALLVRRLRVACQAEHMLCVGTSATMSSGGTLDQQRQEVAGVATRLFGSDVRPENVISETLTRATVQADPSGDGVSGDGVRLCSWFLLLGMVSDFVLGSYVLSSKPKTKSDPDESDPDESWSSTRTSMSSPRSPTWWPGRIRPRTSKAWPLHPIASGCWNWPGPRSGSRATVPRSFSGRSRS